MISAFFILNSKGDPIVFKIYRPDVKRTVADLFRIHVISSPSVRSPILRIGSTTFFHLKYENVFFVCISKCNPNTALVFELMQRVVEILKKFCGHVNEIAVKDNFVFIYELLDEICDFGFPQNTDAEALKLLMTIENCYDKNLSSSSSSSSAMVKAGHSSLNNPSKIAIQATGMVTWRRPDIYYKKNEIYCDVVENLNILISNTGSVLNADIKGQILLKTFLSGMPECRLGLNDRIRMEKNNADGTNNNCNKFSSKEKKPFVQLDDCQFHQCVRLSQIEQEKAITFIPPDGECELMRYRTTENVSVPFKIQVILNELGHSKLEMRVAVRSLYGSTVYAENLYFKIPVPPSTANCIMRVSKGKAKYVGSENCMIWKMHRMGGQREHLFEAEIELAKTSSLSTWTSRPPITVDFQVTAFTASGLLIRFLKVFEKLDYPNVKWVRYITKAGNYQIRVSVDKKK